MRDDDLDGARERTMRYDQLRIWLERPSHANYAARVLRDATRREIFRVARQSSWATGAVSGSLEAASSSSSSSSSSCC